MMKVTPGRTMGGTAEPPVDVGHGKAGTPSHESDVRTGRPSKKNVFPDRRRSSLQLDMKRERDEELTRLRNRAATSAEIKPHEQKALPYLFGAALVDSRIEGEELTRYRSAQETLEHSRSQLFAGRGNVAKDIEESNFDSTRRAYAGQDLADVLTDTSRDMAIKFAKELGVAKIDYRVAWAACARLTGAGNCDENGEVASINHAEKLKDGETIANMDSKLVGHKFPVSMTDTVPRDDDHVIDPWADGPVVRREHSRFAHPGQSTVVYTLDHESGPVLAKQTDKLLNLLSADPEVEAFIAQRLEIYKNKPQEKLLPPGYVWLATPVSSEEFVDKARAKFQPLSSGVTDKTFPTNDVPADTIQRAQLRAEIVGAGVLRSLDKNVKDSTTAAPSLGRIETLDKLR